MNKFFSAAAVATSALAAVIASSPAQALASEPVPVVGEAAVSESAMAESTALSPDGAIVIRSKSMTSTGRHNCPAGSAPSGDGCAPVVKL
ncbi:hypothetical protein [Streptomyces luteolus]|uniref:Secreted protein n=1 Tax=Streptomyces luteolus TaxID=3043615 RepID=A0ABT6SZR9_9ACTN|nr:hypothetical protein [Streptomyces sp. B-S-A12]MDI3420901.1 hypothetical protein [Streptomyces sp. B-S-A12]